MFFNAFKVLLSLDNSGCSLHPEIGTLNLDELTDPDVAPVQTLQERQFRGYGLSPDSMWITWNSNESTMAASGIYRSISWAESRAEIEKFECSWNNSFGYIYHNRNLRLPLAVRQGGFVSFDVNSAAGGRCLCKVGNQGR